MRKPYEKPSIASISSRAFSKHGAPSSSQYPVRSSIDRSKIETLVKDYGSPLFVFSEQALRHKFREAQDEFKSRYSKITFGWSYKTNYLRGICALFHQEGAIAEVVSEFEYQKARNLGVSGSDIIFNGPYKSMQALEVAVSEGALINCDSLDEIRDLEMIAKKSGKKLSIGLRLNMSTGQYADWSRFGFNIESMQAFNAVKRIAAIGLLEVTGLHCHIGTFVLDPGAYSKAVDKVVAFKSQIEQEFGYKINYLDFGGGFASNSRLKGVYQPPEIAVPKITQYANAIINPLLKHFPEGRDQPQIYLELGRYFVDEAGYLITSVVAQKLLPDGRRSYVLDAGVNLLYTSTWYRYKIEMDGPESGVPEPAMLNGPLCMNIDIVDEAILMPRLPRGKRLILSPVGAYNVTQWMQFIQYRPAVCLVRPDGTSCLLRRKEELSDVENCDELPTFLESKLKEAA